MKALYVTGGGQGIGRGIALHFAEKGYAVAIMDRDAPAAREVASLISAAGGKAKPIAMDVAEPGEVDAAFATAQAALGPPDVVVANAGVNCRKPFLELGAEEFDRVLAVNLRGVFLTAQAGARQMVERGSGGAVVTIASTRALMSEANTEAYSASKGGIVALTHAMAISLAGTGIRVNCISPGWIETRDMQRSDRAVPVVHSAEDRDQHPVGRVGRPSDVAEACFYLAEHAGFVTGQNLVLDGGMTVKMIYAE